MDSNNLNNSNNPPSSLVPRSLAITFIIFLLLLVIIIGANQVYGVFSHIQPASSSRTITITAEGRVSASPDTAEVGASIVSNGSTAQATQSGMDQKAAQLLAYLKTSGVAASDISTSGYSLYPQYDYTAGNNNKITGYSASETLQAKIHDLNKVGDILGGITQNGANQIQSVSYIFNDPNQLQEQAREQALSSAGQKAQALADAAGVKLGKLVTFTVDNNNSTSPVYPMAMSVSAGIGGTASAPANISSVPSGTQDIIEDVSVTYDLK